MEKTIAAIHKRLSRACECEHLIFLSDQGEPLAVGLSRVVGVYKKPRLEDLELDVLEAIAEHKKALG